MVFENVSQFTIACVASVSVRFSARSRHFLFFSRAKIGASAKKYVTGEGKGEKETLARLKNPFAHERSFLIGAAW